jgi:uncharacterized membrane protein
MEAVAMSAEQSVLVARRTATRVTVALACTVVALQIAYPLTAVGTPRDRLTVATVVVFFVASVAHAAMVRGSRFAVALVAVTAGGGFLVEAVGVATGLPFGAYAYTETLGWSLLGVPVVIPLAWTMMAYPAHTVARRILEGARAAEWLSAPGRRAVAGAVVGGWALASWDLFLDPQMVDAGHWTWTSAGPAVLGIPLSNFAGWFLVASVMMAMLGRADPVEVGPAVRPGVADDRVPYALYLWTYGSSVLAHAAFFGLPGSALLGGVGMGVVVFAFVRAVRS